VHWKIVFTYEAAFRAEFAHLGTDLPTLRQFPAYSSLSTEARSMYGAFTDFIELDRAQLAETLDSSGSRGSTSVAHAAQTDEG